MNCYALPGSEGFDFILSPSLPLRVLSQEDRVHRKRRAGKILPGEGTPAQRGADSSFLGLGTHTYFHQHKIRRDRRSHRCSPPDGGRTRGGKTGTGWGPGPSRSRIPCGSGGSGGLPCPQSSPRGTRSRTSCGSRSGEDFPTGPSPTPTRQHGGQAEAGQLARRETLAASPSADSEETEAPGRR